MCADCQAKGTEVFVGGLPRSATEGTLREGYGFVRFAERECAYIAKRQKNGIELQGKRLVVDLSLDQDTLFFGNLCKEWSVEEFEELIHKTFKDVVLVDLAMASNLDSSVSKRRLNRGFAFVRFSSHAPYTSGSAVGVENPDDTLNKIARGMFGGYVNASASVDGNYSSPLDDDLALF